MWRNNNTNYRFVGITIQPQLSEPGDMQLVCMIEGLGHMKVYLTVFDNYSSIVGQPDTSLDNAERWQIGVG